MKIHSTMWLLAVLVLQALVIAGCGGGGDEDDGGFEVPPNRGPVLLGIQPTSTLSDGGPFVLDLSGAGFLSTSIVRWDGDERETTFVDESRLQAAIPASDTEHAGRFSVTVSTPGPNGGTSESITFTVNHPVPALDAVTPEAVTLDDGEVTLDISGAGFRSDTVVELDGVALDTAFSTAAAVQAVLQLAELSQGDTFQLTATNPPPGGGASNALSFTVNNPLPLIFRTEPATLTAGGGDSTLDVIGEGFVPDSEGIWNAVVFSTTFLSPERIRMHFEAADIANAGDADIWVSNPTPGGGVSPTHTLTIGSPEPSLSGTGKILLVSQNEAGEAANGGAVKPRMGLDPRWLLFNSGADNLVPDDTNGVPDMFVRDTCQGGAILGCIPSTTRISIGDDGAEFVSATSDPGGFAADGRYAVFTAFRDDVDPSIGGEQIQIVVHDRDADENGVYDEELPGARKAVVVSVDEFGEGADGLVFFSGISRDGRHVAFNSDAANLGAQPGFFQLFVHDRDADGNGIFDEAIPGARRTSLVSLGFDGSPANDGIALGGSDPVALSDDGRTLTFISRSSNLVSDTTPGRQHVYLADRDANGNGIFDEAGDVKTFLVSKNDAGEEADADAHLSSPAMLFAGETIIFSSAATNLDPAAATGNVNVYQHSRDADVDGVLDEPGDVLTIWISRSADGTAIDGDAFGPAASPDGRFVAFASTGSNVIEGEAVNGAQEIYVRDTCLGADADCSPTTVWASRPHPDAAPPAGTFNDQPDGASIGLHLTDIEGSYDQSVWVTWRSDGRLTPEDNDDLVDVYAAGFNFRN